jgi:hypothetical protein
MKPLRFTQNQKSVAVALRGVAPEKVLEQVRNTAAWSLVGPVDGLVISGNLIR